MLDNVSMADPSYRLMLQLLNQQKGEDPLPQMPWGAASYQKFLTKPTFQI